MTHENAKHTNRPSPRRASRKSPDAQSRFKKKLNRVRTWTTNTFFGILVVGFVLGLLVFARPTASALENRNLTEFPQFTWETFVDGSFFSDLSLWYADTFPFRDQLVGLNQALSSLYGIEPEETMIGGNEVADEIPTDAPTDDGLSVSDREQDASDEPVDVPNQRTVAADIQGNIMNGIFIKNGAAYNVYYFNQAAVTKYAAAVSECADKLAGKANVYSIFAPHNSEVMLSKEELSKLSGSDESQAIDYINSLYSDNVKPIKIVDALREHNDEYLYFRTDHHWTQLGAYYAYLEYCKEAGIEPVALEDREKLEFAPYLGSFYQQLNSNALKQNPDTVEAYVPIGTNDLKYLDENGVWQEGKVVRDVTGWNSSSYYNAFIVGDQQLLEIHNPEITDGSSVLVVKDSFANPFITLLVDNYEYVYSIDFRYYNGNIPDFVLQKGIQNVIFLQNPSIAGTNSAATKLQSLM